MSSKSAIEVKGLSKTFQIYKKPQGLMNSFKSLIHREYQNIQAVNDISFSIQPGELVGFIGPNGAGKTTTLKMLSGLVHPTNGEISVLDFKPFQRKREFLKSITLVMGQKNQLWWDLPAIDTFELNKEIYEIPNAQYHETLDELIEMLNLQPILNQFVRNMSLGQRMKCELCASLLHKPKVLFLDEPTIGLDVVMQSKIRTFIKDCNKKNNATVILTSHYMEDVKEICDRIIMIHSGKILYDGKLEEMIAKYATTKTLELVFKDNVKKSELSKFGEVIKYALPKVVIKVPREDSSKIASQILTHYAVDDLNINEPGLDEFVRGLY
jgi:ABC-2 type transport system ATP-binding protein